MADPSKLTGNPVNRHDGEDFTADRIGQYAPVFEEAEERRKEIRRRAADPSDHSVSSRLLVLPPSPTDPEPDRRKERALARLRQESEEPAPGRFTEPTERETKEPPRLAKHGIYTREDKLDVSVVSAPSGKVVETPPASGVRVPLERGVEAPETEGDDRDAVTLRAHEKLRAQENVTRWPDSAGFVDGSTQADASMRARGEGPAVMSKAEAEDRDIHEDPKGFAEEKRAEDEKQADALRDAGLERSHDQSGHEVDPEQVDGDEDGENEDDQSKAKPVNSDPKSAWVNYAVEQGMDRDEAEDTTKKSLVERYG